LNDARRAGEPDRAVFVDLDGLEEDEVVAALPRIAVGLACVVDGLRRRAVARVQHAPFALAALGGEDDRRGDVHVVAVARLEAGDRQLLPGRFEVHVEGAVAVADHGQRWIAPAIDTAPARAGGLKADGGGVAVDIEQIGR